MSIAKLDSRREPVRESMRRYWEVQSTIDESDSARRDDASSEVEKGVVVRVLCKGVSLVLRTPLFALAMLTASLVCGAAPTQSEACDHCVAKQKAQQQASEGRMRHVGGSLGSGGYEGVGFSTRSADEAIRSCCYWGQRTPVGIGVARGTNGWYATVLYR